jgi:hypothetical protein
LALPFDLEANRALVRLQRGAEFAVVVEIEAHGVAQAERGRATGIGAQPAFADTLHRDALRAQADQDRAKILRDIIDELAVSRQVENLLVENPVVPDLAPINMRERSTVAPLAITGSSPPTSWNDPVVARTYSNAAFGTMRLWSIFQ